MTESDSIFKSLHVGYYDLHKDRSINFQLNRWIQYLGVSALADMRGIAPKLKDYSCYRREFLELAERALADGRKLHAGYYFRSAEFFMSPEDPDKRPTRRKFLELLGEYYGLKGDDRYDIPYSDGAVAGSLPAYRFGRNNPKGTIVVHGGFDSYIEEFLPVIQLIQEAGYNIVCFDGPGQGGGLADAGLHLTHEWHKPVKAVLDYFGLDDVTLLGISMGGCLALRAAAFESRVRRVVAYDIFYDWLDNTLSKFEPGGRFVLLTLLNLGARSAFNAVVDAIMRRSPLFDWGMRQAMYVLGVSTSYEVFRRSRRYTTRDISPLVRQDVLLMAGSEDHGVPLDHFYRQIEALRNVRSLTARLFTAREKGQNHCQVGNLGLSLSVIVHWIEQTTLDSKGQPEAEDPG